MKQYRDRLSVRATASARRHNDRAVLRTELRDGLRDYRRNGVLR